MRALSLATAATALLITCAPATAQELEPRAFSPSPIGTNFVLAGYSNTSGDVVFDNSSAVSNVHANIDTATAGYGHVFALAGHQASLAVALPYLRGKATGDLGENGLSLTRSGLGDPQLRFSTILLGAPALEPSAFGAWQAGPTLGASLTVVAPLGQYDPQHVVNIGAHRWAYRPALGVTVPFGHWEADVMAASGSTATTMSTSSTA